MCKRNNSALFFICSLIEQLGRDLHRKRSDVVSSLGSKAVGILLKNADVLHCEPIEKVADDVIGEFRLERGSFDNVSKPGMPYRTSGPWGRCMPVLLRMLPARMMWSRR